MGRHATIGIADVMDMLEKQGYRCALTGRQLTPETASIDHIVPIKRGGTNELTNIQIIDKTVNLAKASMTQDEFVQVCRDVVAYVDATRVLGKG
jgi:5-methylcytosine-specific restriction endonuclease McrA